MPPEDSAHPAREERPTVTQVMFPQVEGVLMRVSLIWTFMVTTAIGCVDRAIFAADDPAPAARSPNRSLSILKLPSLRRELELSPAQIDAMVLLEVDRQQLFRGPLGELQQPTVEERRAAYAEFKRQVDELEKRALDVLLPHQRKRLAQILLQEWVGAFEPTGGVTHPQLAPRLGLVEPQLEAMRQAAIAAEKEFNIRKAELLAEMNKAREAARSKVLAELTPEQRATYEELIGKPYDFTKRD
jgi:hypothetical protein